MVERNVNIDIVCMLLFSLNMGEFLIDIDVNEHIIGFLDRLS